MMTKCKNGWSKRPSLEHTLRRHYLLFHKLRDMKHRVKLYVYCRHTMLLSQGASRVVEE